MEIGGKRGGVLCYLCTVVACRLCKVNSIYSFFMWLNCMKAGQGMNSDWFMRGIQVDWADMYSVTMLISGVVDRGTGVGSTAIYMRVLYKWDSTPAKNQKREIATCLFCR